MAWNPLEVYNSAYVLRCFCFAPNHPSKTTTVLDFADEQSEVPETSIAFGSGKCHLYITSEEEGEEVVIQAVGFGGLANSAGWNKLRRAGEEYNKEGTKLRPESGTGGKLMLGRGTRILVTKEKLASLETEKWEIHDGLGLGCCCKELEVEELTKSDVEEEQEVSEDLWRGSLSAETKATATVVAAAKGRWRIPEKEPILEIKLKISHNNKYIPSKQIED